MLYYISFEYTYLFGASLSLGLWIFLVGSLLNIFMPVSQAIRPITIHLLNPFSSAQRLYFSCIAVALINTEGANFHLSSGTRTLQANSSAFLSLTVFSR